MATQEAPLEVPAGRLPNGSFAYVQPRWSRSCDSAFYWGLWDSSGGPAGANLTVGVLAVSPSSWNWPQFWGLDTSTMTSHLMTAHAAVSGETGGVDVSVRLPLYGMRAWYLLAGPRHAAADAAADAYAAATGSDLERMENVFNLSWPGLVHPPPGDGFCGQAYVGPHTDPQAPPIRERGAALLAALGGNGSDVPPASVCSLSAANVWCDPDFYGAYVGYGSPERPEDFTAFSAMCVGHALSVVARGHPNASYWCGVSWGTWQHDTRHSVALPSGAGQAAPGYLAAAVDTRAVIAPLLDRYCPLSNGSRAVDDPRLVAAVGFLQRTSQPWAFHFAGPAAADPASPQGRVVLPQGDTRPGSVDFVALSNATGVAWPDVTGWVSEAVEGYGAVLRAAPGTPDEVFAAFKASPSRAHGHGDQLSVHYASHGARVLVDVMAGAFPHPLQESWHSRLGFGGGDGGTNADGFWGLRRRPAWAMWRTGS